MLRSLVLEFVTGYATNIYGVLDLFFIFIFFVIPGFYLGTPVYPGTSGRVTGLLGSGFHGNFFGNMDTYPCENRPSRSSRVAPVWCPSRIGRSIFSEFLRSGWDLSDFFKTLGAPVMKWSKWANHRLLRLFSCHDKLWRLSISAPLCMCQHELRKETLPDFKALTIRTN